MRSADGILIGLFLFPGLTLIARCVALSARKPDFTRWTGRIESIHGAASAKLIEKGIIRFPGSKTARFNRAWILAESAMAVSFPLFFFASATPAGRLFSLPASCLAGAAVLYAAHRELARKQLAELRNSLPMASFLVSLLLEGGLGAHSALGEAAAALPDDPLRRELEDIVRSRALGVPRDEALDKSRRRVPLDEYRIFLNLIQQGEKLGIGLSRALREHATKMLESQGHRAETIAQQAAVKLLFPLVVFIFPAVIMVVLSPVILSLCASAAK